MRTLRAAAFGIPVTPDYWLLSSIGWTGPTAFLVYGCRRGSCDRRRSCPALRRAVCREIGELLDVEDEGNPTVAENRGGGDPRDGAIALLDALDHDLLVAA